MRYLFTRADERVILRIVWIYALFSGLWIFLSDTVLGLLVDDPAVIVRLSVVKGLLFITVTVYLLYHLIARYIRKSRQDDEALRAREQEHRLLIEHLPAGVVVHAPDTRVVLCNPEAARLLGLEAEQLVGRPATDPAWRFVREDGSLLPAAEFPVSQMVAGGGLVKNFLMGIERGGTLPRIWVLVNAYPEYDDKRTLRQVVVTFMDVSERKAAEEKIRRHLAHLTALVEIDRAINYSFDLKLSLATLLSHVIEQLHVDAAAVRLYDAATDSLDYVAGRGFYTRAVEQAQLRAGESCAWRAAHERHLVHLPDLAAQADDYLRCIVAAGEDFVSCFGVPLVAKGQIKGVLEIFHRTPLAPDPAWVNFLQALADQAAIAIDNTTLFTNLQQTNAELAAAYNATIEGWSRALDLRDNQTEGHSQRVAELTVRLARLFGMSEADLVHVRWGALLHDIGKMGVPDTILRNVEALSDEEWAVMKQHPLHAWHMLAPIPYLQKALEIPYAHHEKWDGSGYPRGLKGGDIPLAARIFAVVDVWDALRSERYYRQAWPVEKVREHLRSLAGTHFDPHVVQVCLDSDVLTM